MTTTVPAIVIIISVTFIITISSLPWTPTPINPPPSIEIIFKGSGTAVADNAVGEIITHVNDVASPVLNIRRKISTLNIRYAY